MSQIFHATAYDIEAKTRFTMNADKFQTNCYSYSGAVCAMHYLLRQQPYHIMWGGDYVTVNDNIRRFPREEDLMGISTYTALESFKQSNKNLHKEVYFDKIQRIESYSKGWTSLKDVLNKALKYFNYKKTQSVRYSGYLVNHTKKLAVCLTSYWKESTYYGSRGLSCIDLVPALTETGGGFAMALFERLTPETTKSLDGMWCGDLLEIIDESPKGYAQIICCFANQLGQKDFYRDVYGTDEQGYQLKDQRNELCA